MRKSAGVHHVFILTAFLQWWKQISSLESPFKNNTFIAALLTVGCKWLAYALHWIVTFACVVLAIFNQLAWINSRVTSLKWSNRHLHVVTQIHIAFVLLRAVRLADRTLRSWQAFWFRLWYIIRPITIKVTTQSTHFRTILSWNRHSYNCPAVPLNR